MDGSGEQPRGGGEAGGGRPAGGREGRGRGRSPASPGAPLPAWGRAIPQALRGRNSWIGLCQPPAPALLGGSRLAGLRAPVPFCRENFWTPENPRIPESKPPRCGQARTCRRHHFLPVALVGGAGPTSAPQARGPVALRVPPAASTEVCRILAQAPASVTWYPVTLFARDPGGQSPPALSSLLQGP
jgi:hypothetical protein